MCSARLMLLAAVATLAGCGPSLKTHPVEGRVVLTEGKIEDWTDSHVEFASASDATVRGSGLIASDGSFHVEMLHQGQVLHGLPPGSYHARVIRADEGPAARKARAAVPRRYLDFKTAGISITVPPPEDVVVMIGKK